MEDGYSTVEQAALSGFPAGEARVLDVRVDNDDHVTVHLEVNASTGYDGFEFCERRYGRWFNYASGG
jgi:hypothetical protein